MSNKTIGIFCAGQWGDCGTISSVLKYKNELWGEDCKIVWYISNDNADLLRWQPNLETREFPRGFGYPEMVEIENKKLIELGKEPIWKDWQPLVNEHNHMDLELKKYYPELEEISYGYFPAPHQVPLDKRRNVPYPLVSKNVFGISDELEWHPLLYFSEYERDMADYFFNHLPKCKNVCFETMAGSGQSKLTDIQVIDAIDICRKELGECNIIFTSHKFLNGNEIFPEGLINNVDTFSIADFTVRQTALITGKADLMISVSSGTTVAASCWGNNAVPILAYCGSEICGTRALALGEYVLVSHDGKSLRSAWEEFKIKLIELLKNIK